MWGHRQWGGMRRGWLRPWIISIVSRAPKNGAEIIEEVERMSWGGWRPSPGSIYPLLDQMTVEGTLRKSDDGRYALTEKGKEEGNFPFGFPFGQKPASVESMVNEMRDYVSYFEDLARSSPSKLDPYKNRLTEIRDRLSKLL